MGGLSVGIRELVTIDQNPNSFINSYYAELVTYGSSSVIYLSCDLQAVLTKVEVYPMHLYNWPWVSLLCNKKTK